MTAFLAHLAHYLLCSLGTVRLTYIAEKEKTGPVHEGETAGVKDQLLFLFMRN